MGEPETKDKPLEVKILLEIRPGRWGKVFHLSDREGGKVKLELRDAVKVAKTILRITKTS